MMGEATAAPKAGDKPKTDKANTSVTRAVNQPRQYLVFREVKLSDLRADESYDQDRVVLVELGAAEAKTPKEARRTVAKAKLDEAVLRGDGVTLRAITKGAAEAGRGIARLKVEPTWDD